VLVADDSVVVRSLLRRQLEEHDYRVVEALDGEDALRVCREERPDVVLLDVEMPKLDGHGVLEAMQFDPLLAGIPVVFCTGRTTTEDVVEGLRLGAHDYLRKPFEVPELVARVSAAVRVKILQDELRERNAELDEMSRVDVLTGLANRRHLQEHLVAAVSAAQHQGSPLAVLMLDVDRFKSINDTRGHEVGDQVLMGIAARLAAACRAEDIAGRWGGEEFLVVAPCTDRDAAMALAGRVRSLIADEAISIHGGGPVAVTASVGVVSGSDDLATMLRRADAALYAAKEAGRNHVVDAADLDE
jgi:diguanylate cyclase (GGDEF)-like protein